MKAFKQALDTIAISNPRTGEILYNLMPASAQEIQSTFQRANKAFKLISKMSIKERLKELAKLKIYVIDNMDEIIASIIAETGKAKNDAIIEIYVTVAIIDYYTKNAEGILSSRKVSELSAETKEIQVHYEPMGTILSITPWNYPFSLAALTSICAFVAGNAVIIKPSEYTPLVGVYEKMLTECGFMPDAIQMIYGGKETGSMCIDAQPNKIIFTGSVRGGQAVYEHAANYLIPVELELGGNDPMVVFDDANLDRAVAGAVYGSTAHSGQICISTERVIVHEAIHDDFVKKLTEKIQQVRTPSKLDENEDTTGLEMCYMTTDFQTSKIKKQIEDAVAKGAKILFGGHELGGGNEFEPTIITNVTADMDIAKDETFGPIIVIQKFSSEEQAMELANNTEYGLSSCIWTDDLERARRLAHEIEAGSCIINNCTVTSYNPTLPFGGVKKSGFGRYLGEEGLKTFSNVKTVILEKNSDQLDATWYPYTKESFDAWRDIIKSMK